MALITPETRTAYTPGPEHLQPTIPVDEDHGTFMSVKKEEPDDQDQFFCELCRTFFTNECNVHGPPVFVPDTRVPNWIKNRAIQTLPPGLEVRESSIPDAGFGVFNKGDVIPVGAHFGPYQGEAVDSGDSGVICKTEPESDYKDLLADKNGNWMRFVKCARNNDERNLVAFRCQGRILYRCCRPIHPGQELLLSWAEDLSDELNGAQQVISCSFCRLSQTSQVDLNAHVKQCHGKPKDSEQGNLTASRTSSHHCGDYHRTPPNIKHRQKQEKVHCCPDCGKRYAKKSYLQKHQHIHTREKPYQCTQCGKNFGQHGSLQQHLRIHTGDKPYRCSQCGKNFRQQRNLQQHQRIHTGEKPYQCTHCGRSFTRQSHLQRHQRIHTGEKPYQCAECGKSFTQQSYLQLHQRIHTGEKPYRCPQCGRSFTRQGHFQMHRRIHTGEKPYQCLQCGKSFTRRISLQVHQRIHTGEKPYQCTQCGKSFTHKTSLQQHQHVHTGEKPYYCAQCGKNFTHQRTLKHHQRIHTRETCV